jgi:hypothetical protein
VTPARGSRRGLIRAVMLVALLMSITLTGCGVQSSGRARAIDPAQVPFGLVGSTPTSPASLPATATADATPAGAAVYFLQRDRLVGIAIPRPPADPRLAIGLAIDILSSGPSAAERARALDTAVPTSVQLAVRDVTGSTATIDIQGGQSAIVNDQGPLAVGQVVLTATSIPGIDSVLLTRDGQRVDAQLADGALTGRPLTREDFRSLLARVRTP